MGIDRYSKVLLLNMCMVKNGSRVLVLDKIGSSWDGLTFPGGHAEPGESLTTSVIREVKEESGLMIDSPKLLGTVHWYHPGNGSHWIIFLYKTETFSGTLNGGSREGRVFWMELDEFQKGRLASGMSDYLKIFLASASRLTRSTTTTATALLRSIKARAGIFPYLQLE
jgi:8-oxo-dGTP diphosphatase